MPDFSSTQENTARVSAGIIWQIWPTPSGVQYIAMRGVSN